MNNGNTSPARAQTRFLHEIDYPQTHFLLCAYIRAAAEKSASILAKTIMNDLERRLERQFRARGFETFLIGVILLNCAEKMSWYFKTFEDPKRSKMVCSKSIKYQDIC